MMENGLWRRKKIVNPIGYPAAGPFADEGQAHNAAIKLQEGEARAEYDAVAKLDTGEPVILRD